VRLSIFCFNSRDHHKCCFAYNSKRIFSVFTFLFSLQIDVYVNQKHKKDFRCARYTTFGKYEMDVYSIETISSYMEEIMTYLLCSYYIEDGIKNVMLWRGHFPLCLMGIEILLPIHSLTLFLCLIFLIERPTYVPSFCCAGVAWFLLAVMGYRRNSPNPWDQVRVSRQRAGPGGMIQRILALLIQCVYFRKLSCSPSATLCK